MFTPSSVEHLTERDIDADDVADVVFARYGPVRVRRGGRGECTRWFIVAPLSGGELMTCVLRVARSHDLDSKDAFVFPAPSGAGKHPDFNRSMRVASARAYRRRTRSGATGLGDAVKENDNACHKTPAPPFR